MKHRKLLDQVIDEQPYPLLFVTVSGAHLYGFDSPDSDYDLRSCHVLPGAKAVVGLEKGPDTIDASGVREGVELDFVSHDAEKFFGLMLKKNGYVLEQVFSPLILRGGELHDRLKIKDLDGRRLDRHALQETACRPLHARSTESRHLELARGVPSGHPTHLRTSTSCGPERCREPAPGDLSGHSATAGRGQRRVGRERRHVATGRCKRRSAFARALSSVG